MFTGIIREIGKVKEIKKSSQGLDLEIACTKALENKKIGDSIAVNGACLTIVKIGSQSLHFEVIN